MFYLTERRAGFSTCDVIKYVVHRVLLLMPSTEWTANR